MAMILVSFGWLAGWLETGSHCAVQAVQEPEIFLFSLRSAGNTGLQHQAQLAPGVCIAKDLNIDQTFHIQCLEDGSRLWLFYCGGFHSI